MEKGREIFLFGAGAVIDWNGPKTDEITNAVRKNRSVFTLINSNTLITEFIYQKLIDAGYLKDEVNFETIINVIEELIVYYSEFNSDKKTPSLLKVFLSDEDLDQIFNYSIKGGVRKHLYTLQIPKGKEYGFARMAYNNENTNQFFLQHLLANLLTDIHNSIANYSWDTDGHSVIEKSSENSLNFRRWIKHISDNNIIRLYSLNYDNVFPSLLREEGIDCFDGFNSNKEDDYHFKVDLKSIVSDIISPVFYNLHGSSYWKVLPQMNGYILRPEIVKVEGIRLPLSDVVSLLHFEKGKNVFVSNIITGYQKTQKSSLTPFRQMQSAFDRDCLFADKITIVGYSFGDEHINEAIRMALKYNQKLKIEIVEPNFNNTDKYFEKNIFPIRDKIDREVTTRNLYSYFKGKMKVYELYFSDYLKQINKDIS